MHFDDVLPWKATIWHLFIGGQQSVENKTKQNKRIETKRNKTKTHQIGKQPPPPPPPPPTHTHTHSNNNNNNNNNKKTHQTNQIGDLLQMRHDQLIFTKNVISVQDTIETNNKWFCTFNSHNCWATLVNVLSHWTRFQHLSYTLKVTRLPFWIMLSIQQNRSKFLWNLFLEVNFLSQHWFR